MTQSLALASVGINVPLSTMFKFSKMCVQQAALSSDNSFRAVYMCHFLAHRDYVPGDK